MCSLICIRGSASYQRGMSLLFSLLILLVMSVSGVAAIQVAGLQERSAGNYRDRTLAFNAAESALRDAENYLSTEPNLPLFDGATAGHYPRNGVATTGLTRLPALAVADGSSVDLWKDPAAVTFMRTNGIPYGTLPTPLPPIPDLPTQPRFVIEMANASDKARMRTYRITSMAEGRDSALVVLQTYYTPPQFTVTP